MTRMWSFSALKLLGRRFDKASRLVVSSKTLHHVIPTKNCDIVMMLPSTTDDTTLMWLLARLRSRTPYLHVHVRHLTNTKVYGFYMTASYDKYVIHVSQAMRKCVLCHTQTTKAQSACASTQSDQRLCCLLQDTMIPLVYISEISRF